MHFDFFNYIGSGYEIANKKILWKFFHNEKIHYSSNNTFASYSQFSSFLRVRPGLAPKGFSEDT